MMSDKIDLLISHFNKNNYSLLMGDFIQRNGIEVIIERIEKNHLFDMDLDTFIIESYLNRSEYCVILFSNEYYNNLWSEENRLILRIDELNKLNDNLMFVCFDEESEKIIESYDNKINSNGPDYIDIAKIYLSKTKKYREDDKIYAPLYPEEIDSFEKIINVRPEDISDVYPLNILEKDVKQNFCDIISELDVSKDWGGETSDLFTDIMYCDRRTATAFMFKGRGLRQRLTLAKCGTNGDQIQRLVREPAFIYVIQHVRKIDPSVISHLALYVENTARKRGEKLYFCYIDGVDTARIFKAYDKPLQSD